MSTAKIKSDLIRYIEEINDKNILSALKDFLSSKRKNKKDFWDDLSVNERKEILMAMKELDNGLSYSFNDVVAKLPAEILVKVDSDAAERAVKLMSDAAAKAELVIYNLGPDVERGWGARRSVARDFLNDSPVLLGSVRVGPDLASIGTRAPEKFAAPWKFATTNTASEFENHLLVHLYNPRLLAPASTCPSASYLFEKQKPEVRHAGEPLIVSKGLPPVFPKHNAHALVAYLLTQRTDVGLPEAPVPSLVKAAVATPAPALGTTPPAKP